jgi:hypothetical protein
MTYKFLRDGVEEEVQPEVWQWVAHFSDGSILKQFDDDGRFHQIGEIDQEKLVAFQMVSSKFPQVYTLPFIADRMRLVHKYINTGLGLGTPEFRKIRSYCFGYKTRGLPENTTSLMVIVPSGEVIMCEDSSIIKFE